MMIHRDVVLEGSVNCHMSSLYGARFLFLGSFSFEAFVVEAVGYAGEEA